VPPELNEVPCHGGIWGYRGIAPHILNLCTRWTLAVRFTPRPPLLRRKLTPVPSEQEAGWCPRSMSNNFNKRKISYPCRESNPDFSVVQPIVYRLGFAVKRRKKVSAEFCFRLKYSCENHLKRSRVFLKYLMWTKIVWGTACGGRSLCGSWCLSGPICHIHLGLKQRIDGVLLARLADNIFGKRTKAKLLAGGRAPWIQTGSNRLENILIHGFHRNTCVCGGKGTWRHRKSCSVPVFTTDPANSLSSLLR
jgi:hypothetical protein